MIFLANTTPASALIEASPYRARASRPRLSPPQLRSIPSRPAGRRNNSKEVGRTKRKDLSSYFLERGKPRLSRGWGGVGQEIQSLGQHHPGASRHPSSAEEGSFVRLRHCVQSPADKTNHLKVHRRRRASQPGPQC